MGGRTEVLFTPACEVLKYFELQLKEEEAEFEREKMRHWIEYLSRIFSQPSTGEEQADYHLAKNEFIGLLSPADSYKAPPKEYKWDFELSDDPDLLIQESGEGG